MILCASAGLNLYYLSLLSLVCAEGTEWIMKAIRGGGQIKESGVEAATDPFGNAAKNGGTFNLV